MPATRTWLKNPLAIFTANGLDARGGLVLQDGLIVEVLAARSTTFRTVDKCSMPASM